MIASSQTLTLAQVIPDQTLGAESSLIQAINELNERIDGGATRGSNLFHSFLEFNVGEGRGVYFANPAEIENILSRVTGSNPSQILGQLGVLGSANLFLLNPNGIVFGPNASLDIEGSFYATIADGIQLGENGFFSASDPHNSTLLSVSPGTLFFNQASNHSGSIINRGNLAVGKDLTLAAGNLDLQGQLYSGGNLSLQGLNSVIIRDTVTNPFVAAAVGDLLVQGNQTVDIFALNHPASGLVSGEDLVLRSGNQVLGDAHYWSGGNFRIEELDGSLGELLSIEDPVIRSLGDVSFDAYQGTSLHILAGGSVNIPNFIQIAGADPVNGIVETVILSDDTTVNIDGRSEPTLDIRAGVDPFVVGGFFFDFFDFFPFNPNSTNSIINPNAGNIPTSTFFPTSANINIGTIYFTDLTGSLLTSGGTVFLTNQYQPNENLSGNIQVLPTVFPSISIQTSSFGDGGLIVLDSKESIDVNGAIQAAAFPITLTIPLIFVGDGGDVTLLAQDNLTFAENVFSGIISNGLLGGDITLKAGDTISLNGGSVGSQSFTNLAGAKGGELAITARDLVLKEGTQLSTSTFGQADAGNLTITTSGVIELTGTATNNSQLPTGIFSQSEPGATGNAGKLTITTSDLRITDGAQISASTFGGNARGGDVDISATNSVEVTGTSPDGMRFSRIISQTDGDGGTAGNLIINTEQLVLRDSANLSTTTFGTGDGGKILINADLVEVDGFLTGIAAFNFTGKGGEIEIDAKKLRIQNGGGLVANAIGTGDAGRIIINASESVEVIGTSPNSLTFSTLSTQTFGSGRAGDLEISTQQLIVRDGGGINTRTQGTGDAGNLTVNASDFIQLSGQSPDGRQVSNLSSQSESRLGGNAGDIRIATKYLSIEDSAAISTATISDGQGGVLTIDAEKFIAQDGGAIIAVTQGEGNAGNISIRVSDFIRLSGTTSNGSMPSGAFTQASSGSSGNAGNLEIIASELLVQDGAVISSGTLGQGNGGRLTIDTEQLTIQDGGAITTSTSSGGNSGEIIINASEFVQVIGEREGLALPIQQDLGFSTDTLSRITSQVGRGAKGNAADLTINTQELLIRDGGQVDASTFGTGRGGILTINASNSVDIVGASRNNLALSQVSTGTVNSGDAGSININTSRLTVLEGAQVTASTFAEGDGGSLNINASELIELNGKNSVFDFVSNLSSTAFLGATGNAGNLNIQTQQLKVINEAQINVDTLGQGNAGQISIQATDLLELANRAAISSTIQPGAIGNSQQIIINTPNLFLTDSSGIFAATAGQGNSGSILISNAELISLNQSGIIASTFGQGNAGEIILQAETITLDSNSAIATAVNPDATGQGGNITIQTTGNTLTFNNRSQISSSSQGQGDAGDILIDSLGTVTLTNSDITTSSESASGGEINLTASDIRLEGDSDISTNVNSGAGGGGDITLTADSIILFDDSDILAFAQDGQGGNITLNTDIFFGDGFQAGLDNVDLSLLDGNGRVDINASGAVSGTITLPNLTFIPNSLTELPENIVDTANLIANSCVTHNRRQAGTFVITGSGGVPVRPGDVAVSPYPTGEVRTFPNQDATNSWKPGDTIIEPQNSYRLSDGRLILSREC